jgi:hypothetical protein
VSLRPLVFLTGLTVGDFLLWNWSLNGNHDVLALASGLTLPPLAVAFLWLLALNLARLIALIARRPAARKRARTSTARAATSTPQANQAQAKASAGTPSRKIAA